MPQNFWRGIRRYLVCDGYDGYHKLKTAARCGCLAHVRRKFVDALPTDKELLSTSAAAKGVESCNRLFQLEREFAALTPEARNMERHAKSKPLLHEFFAWLDNITVSGGSKLARAVSYARSEKKYPCRFLESPGCSNRQQPRRKRSPAFCHWQKELAVFRIRERG